MSLARGGGWRRAQVIDGISEAYAACTSRSQPPTFLYPSDLYRSSGRWAMPASSPRSLSPYLRLAQGSATEVAGCRRLVGSLLLGCKQCEEDPHCEAGAEALRIPKVRSRWHCSTGAPTRPMSICAEEIWLTEDVFAPKGWISHCQCMKQELEGSKSSWKLLPRRHTLSRNLQVATKG